MRLATGSAHLAECTFVRAGVLFGGVVGVVGVGVGVWGGVGGVG